MSRTCGTRTLCCELHRIPELNKPGGIVCEFDTGTSCSQYDNRPTSCRQYNCTWIVDAFGISSEKDRPDKLGVLFDLKDERTVQISGRAKEDFDSERVEWWISTFKYNGLDVIFRLSNPWVAAIRNKEQQKERNEKGRFIQAEWLPVQSD